MKVINTVAFALLLFPFAPLNAVGQQAKPGPPGKDQGGPCQSSFAKRHFKSAIVECRKAASRGDAFAETAMGIMNFGGFGIERNYDRAREWFLKGAKQGNPSAQHGLGVIYHDGYGVGIDNKAAYRWFHLAAEKGLVDAQFYVGEMLYLGSGTKKNIPAAYRWSKLAAERGSKDAQYNYGAMLYNGDGTKADPVKGLVWLTIAAENGSEKAKTAVKPLYARYPPEVVNKLRTMAREFVNAPPGGPKQKSP